MIRVRLPAIHVPIEKWVAIASIVAALAQVAMLILVWYGYEYTVKPVFEMNLLQEHVAQLELEKNNLTAANNELAHHLETQANALVALNAELRNSELKISDTNGKLSTLEGKYKISERNIRFIKGQILHYNSQLRHAQIELMSVLFSSKLVMVQLAHSNVSNIFSDLDKSDAAELLRKAWPNPYEDMLDTLKQVEANNVQTDVLPKWILNNVKEYIEKNKVNLKCTALDFDKVVAGYRDEKKAADQRAVRQLPGYLAQVIKEESKPNTQVVITQQFKDQSLAILKAEEEAKVTDAYYKQLTDASLQCAQKAWLIYKGLTKAIGARTY